MHYLGIDWASDNHDLCLLAEDAGAGYTTVDNIKRPIEGLTPRQPTSKADWDKMYLGSEMTIAGITHEFGHQLDRRFNLLFSAPDSVTNSLAGDLITKDKIGILNNPYPTIVGGRAGVEAPLDPGEIVADLFMTSVLNDEGFAVYEPLPVLRNSTPLPTATPDPKKYSGVVKWNEDTQVGRTVEKDYLDYLAQLLLK